MALTSVSNPLKKLKYILYADDLVLLSNEPGDLQLGLNSLQQYCRDNNLVVNVSKTNVLPFYKGFPPKNLSPQFGDEPLKVVNEFVYLGITFTTRLSSSKHIRRIITKCKSRIAYLFTKLHISEIPLSTALDVFNIFILPIITYAIPVWFNTFSKTAGNLLNSCFTKYLKRFLAVPYSTNNALIYQITSTTPLLNSLTKIHQKQFNNLSFPLSMEGFKLNPTSPYCPPIPTSPDYINLCPIQLPTSSSIPVLKDPKRALLYATLDLHHSHICNKPKCFHSSSDESSPPCICRFCSDPINNYHTFFCPSLSHLNPCALMKRVEETERAG